MTTDQCNSEDIETQYPFYCPNCEKRVIGRVENPGVAECPNCSLRADISGRAE